MSKAKVSGNVSQRALELCISNKSLRVRIKRYGERLDVEAASQKELVAWVRQLEHQLAMCEE